MLQVLCSNVNESGCSVSVGFLVRTSTYSSRLTSGAATSLVIYFHVDHGGLNEPFVSES